MANLTDILSATFSTIGPIGYTGSASTVQGPIGYTGSMGFQGIQGSVGYTGSASTVQGPIGYTGSQGDRGIQGSVGYTGSASTVQGPIGYTGSQGPTLYPNPGIPVSTGSAWQEASKTVPAGGLVGTTDTQTLSNKTFSDFTAFTKGVDLGLNQNPAAPPADHTRLFARSSGGRVIPAFIGPSGLDSTLQPSIAKNKVAWANPVGNGTVMSVMGIALTAIGTATSASVAVTNVHTSMRRIEYAVATASTTAVAGFYNTVAQYFIGDATNPYGGFFLVCRFGPSRGSASNTTKRGFCGFSSSVGASTDVNPSTGLANVLGVGCDSTDANWQFMHRNASGTPVKFDMGSSFPKAVTDNTVMYELIMFAAPLANTVTMQFTNLGTGATTTYTASSSLPAATTLLSPRAYFSVGGTSSVIGLSLASLYIETDY